MAPITLAIINQKGGVGKTTTALNLAVGLAKGGYRVLAIDLDPQAHLTLGLQIEGNDLPADRTVAALFLRGGTLGPLIVPTAEPNLQVVPSSIRLARAAESFYGVHFREAKLQHGIREIQDGLDYILIDCPPNLGVLTVNAVVAANRILIPTQLSMYSLDGLSDLLDTLTTIKGDAADCDWRILLTMISGHAEERNQTAAKLLAPLAHRLLRTQIRRTEAIERSQFRDDRGLSAVVLEKAWNRGAQDYRNLTKELIALWST